jgi:DNA-binding transcriptional ArsR family regulator
MTFDLKFKNDEDEERTKTYDKFCDFSNNMKSLIKMMDSDDEMTFTLCNIKDKKNIDYSFRRTMQQNETRKRILDILTDEYMGSAKIQEILDLKERTAHTHLSVMRKDGSIDFKIGKQGHYQYRRLQSEKSKEPIKEEETMEEKIHYMLFSGFNVGKDYDNKKIYFKKGSLCWYFEDIDKMTIEQIKKTDKRVNTKIIEPVERKITDRW